MQEVHACGPQSNVPIVQIVVFEMRMPTSRYINYIKFTRTESGKSVNSECVRTVIGESVGKCSTLQAAGETHKNVEVKKSRQFPEDHVYCISIGK